MVRLALLGTPAVAVPVLARLAASQQVHAVVCNPDRPQGRGRHLEAPPVKREALVRGLPVFQPESWKLPETRTQWEALAIDLALVVAYGHILPRWMLDACPLGVWNLHFSLLPRWRGASPVNHAILAGDAETGVSLMRITPGLDAGPVLATARCPIGLEDTAEALLERLAEDAAELLALHLPLLLKGLAEPIPQDDRLATVAPKLSREMARLDFARPALDLHRQARALQPWPGTEFILATTVFKVCAVGGLRATTQPQATLVWDRTGAWLAAGDGQALELTRLQRPGKPVQTALQSLQPWGTQGRVTVS
jgi:methionyl-tRNA formyltransferase